MTLPTVLFYVLAALTAVSALAVVVTQNIVRAATWLLFTLAGVAGIFFLLGADFVGATQLLVYVGGTLVLVVFGVMLTAQGPFINMRIGAAEWLIALAAGLLLFGVLAVSLAGMKRPDTWKEDLDAQQAQRDAEDERQARARGELDLLLRLRREIPDLEARKEKLEREVRTFEAEGQTADADETRRLAKEIDKEIGSKKKDLARLQRPALTQRELAPSKQLGAAMLGDHRSTPHAELPLSPGTPPRDRAVMNYLLPFEIVSVHLLVVLIGAAYLARAKRRRGATS